MIKYVVGALMLVGASLGISAQAAPVSPSTVQTEAVATVDTAVQKVQHWRYGSHRRHWRGGRRWGWGFHSRWRSHYRWGSGRRRW